MAVKAYTLEQTGPQVQQAIDKSLNLGNATQSTDGLMSKQDKQKLDSLDSELAGKVDKVQGKGLSTNDFTDEEKSKTDSAYQKPVDGIPASDLAEGVIPDTSQFITKTVNDLANYYLKTETYAKNEVYNKSEVDSLVQQLRQFTYEVVSELPEASASTMYKIYLVPSADPQTQNVKDEYITLRSGVEGSYTYSWEQIGSTAIDLSGYVTTTDLNTALAAYTTTANLTTLLAAKQDVINDLATIRSGAAAGATAYQKPAGGIPKTDMDSGVQGSLEKADSALQFTPSGEIDPTITPSEYATQEQLEQLDLKLNNLAMTRYYGFFPTAGDLPANASELGYAYVGSSTPLAIYEFDGEDWNDAGVTVNSIQGEPGEDGVGFESVTSPSPADGTFIITLTNGDTITVDMNHSHPAYYSKVAETSNPSGGFLPDVAYNLGEISGTVTFTLAAAVTGQLNHYFWMFSTGASAPTVTFPTTGITWAAGSAPTVAANKHYEISILGGIAAYLEV